MIPWQKYDPKNPPEEGELFLVLNDRKDAYIAEYEEYALDKGWWTLDGSLIVRVSYYAPINLPGEGET